jgi:hypothetical protein
MITVIKSEWAGHVAFLEKIKKSQNTVVQNTPHSLGKFSC